MKKCNKKHDPEYEAVRNLNHSGKLLLCRIEKKIANEKYISILYVLTENQEFRLTRIFEIRVPH